ncbi:MAG: hypothetical protein AAFV53_06035 [Myxococcota bacterium]
MRPTHRLDLILVSNTVERHPDAAAFADVCAAWRAAGRLVGDGPGEGTPLVDGGFRRLWLDLPARVTLYANHQGGYYVRCPITQGNLAREFSVAVEQWRAGEPRTLACPHCGQIHPLEEVRMAPPGAFGRGAVIFSDVGSMGLGPGVEAALMPVLGECQAIGRRVG